MASEIRRNISQRVSTMDEDVKDQSSEIETGHMPHRYKTMEEKQDEIASNKTLNYNPSHSNRKRRSMR